MPEVFSLCDDVLLYNDRVVIPNSLQRKILKDFHVTSGEEVYEKPHALLCILAKYGLRDIADMIESCKGPSHAETMFARKIKSVFDRLIPWQAKFKKTVSPYKKYFYPGDKVLVKAKNKNKTTLHSGM